jgi:hypothetical protein
MTLAQHIREAPAQGDGTAREIAGRLGQVAQVLNRCQQQREAGRVWSRLGYLWRSGQVSRRPGPEGWIFALNGGRPPVQDKLRRAVPLLSRKYRVFSWPEVARLSGADPDYLRRGLRFWEGAGVLLRAGKGGNLLLYSLAPGWEGNKFPHFNRRALKAGIKGQG